MSLETPHGDRPAPKEPAENSGWGPGGDSGSLGLERGAAPTPRGPSCPGPGSKPPGKARVWGTVPPSGRGEADVCGREGRFRGHLSRGAQQDTSPAQATWRACGPPGRLLGRPRGQRPGDRPRAEETKHVGARREVEAAWSPLHPPPPGQRRKGAQPRDRPKTAVDLRPALARGQGQSQPHVITPSQRGTRALAPITKGGPLAPIPRVGCVLWSGHKLPDRHGWGRGATAANTRPILQHTRKEDRQAPTPGASDARTASGPPLQRGPHEHTARRAAPSAPRREQRRDQNQP